MERIIELWFFYWKKMREMVNTFVFKVYSDNRENHDIEIPFCFIPICRMMAEIQGLEV